MIKLKSEDMKVETQMDGDAGEVLADLTIGVVSVIRTIAEDMGDDPNKLINTFHKALAEAHDILPEANEPGHDCNTCPHVDECEMEEAMAYKEDNPNDKLN